MVAEPALYVGRLRHRRFGPRAHAFTYRLFMALVDIDHVDAQMRVSPFTSKNRFNWATFDDRDHLGDPAQPLRDRLREDGARQGLLLPDGPIRLLTHLRYLGYAFNPISFYYCYDAAGHLDTIVGEVHNTFGDQCTYWLPRARSSATDGAAFRQRLPKIMHVSPFMGMDLDYEFALTPPGATLVAHMTTAPRGDAAAGTEPFFDATLTLERRPWTASTVHRALARHPLMTATVIGAIHWQALRLWAKGLAFHPNPSPAARRRKGSTQEAEV